VEETYNQFELQIVNSQTSGSLQMDKAKLHQILLTMSFTRRYEGAGLSLAISHRLAKMLGGTLEVESQIKQGSTFVLSLPLITPLK